MFFLHIKMCNTCVPSDCGGQKRATSPLKSPHKSPCGHQVFHKSNKCSQWLPQLSILSVKFLNKMMFLTHHSVFCDASAVFFFIPRVLTVLEKVTSGKSGINFSKQSLEI